MGRDGAAVGIDFSRLVAACPQRVTQVAPGLGHPGVVRERTAIGFDTARDLPLGNLDGAEIEIREPSKVQSDSSLPPPFCRTW